MDAANEDIPEKPEEKEEETGHESRAADVLTSYLRRTSRGRIVDLPRWAQ